MVKSILFVFLFLSWLAFGEGGACTGELSSGEYDALEALFDATHGENWRWDPKLPTTTQWSFPVALSEPCSRDWQGLNCSKASKLNCFVFSIDLIERNLSGTIPTEIGQLSRISNIRFSENRIMGSLPLELFTLTSLELLDVDSNSITGTLPTEIGQLVNLKQLYTYQNRIEGTLPTEIGLLQELEVLFGYSNLMNGTLPIELTYFSVLQQLNMLDNSFEGTIPSELGNVTTLLLLTLSQNLFFGTIPSELGQLHDLEVLYLYQNRLTGTLPTELGQLSRLDLLDCHFNSLTGTVPSEYGNLISVTYYSLAYNLLTGSLTSSVGNMSSMLYYMVYDTFVTGSVPSEMALMSNLEYMNFQANIMSGTIPESICILGNLQTLYFNGNLFTGLLPKNLTALGSILSLFLDYNAFSGHLPDTSRMRYLHTAVLDNNAFSGPIPTGFGHNERMETLSIENNKLTGTIPNSFGNCVSLQYLSINSNSITGSIPYCLGGLLELLYFDVGNNLMTGQIPPKFGTLDMRNWTIYPKPYGGSSEPPVTVNPTNFTSNVTTNSSGWNSHVEYMALDSNYLTGSFPEGAWSKRYRSVNVSSNFLHGTLSEKICNVSRIQSISMNHNFLSSSVPPCFRNLRMLQQLDVSFNSLTGSLDYLFSESDDPNIGEKIFSALSVINMSNNWLTGQLPGDMFKPKRLKTVVLYSNCFHGSLPVGMCDGANLTELILDALSSAQPCLQPSLKPVLQGIFPKWYLSGTIPSCIWSMPYLKVLHLAGNGLQGMLPDLGVQSNLQDLSLANNMLSGTLPLSFQTHGGFQQLDLSSNKLSGTLSVTYNVSATQQMLNFSVNRLSGPLPQTIVSSGSGVNVLTGNLFQCNENNLPSSDPAAHQYVCGSDDLNASLFAWGAVAGLVALLIAGYVLYTFFHPNPSSATLRSADEKDRVNITSVVVSPIQRERSSGSSSLGRDRGRGSGVDERNAVSESGYSTTRPSGRERDTFASTLSLAKISHVPEPIHNFLDLYLGKNVWTLLKKLMNCTLILVGCYVTVVLAMLIILKKGSLASKFATHTEQYLWVSTAAYLHHVLPSALLICTLMCSIIVVSYTCKPLASGIGSRPTVVANTASTTCNWSRINWNGLLIAFVMHLVNIVVVLTVNIVYVYLTLQGLSPTVLFLVQISLGSFKLVWNSGAVPVMVRYLQAMGGKQEMAHRMVMVLFGYIGGPFVSTFFSESSCFLYVVTGQPSIDSSYNQNAFECVNQFASYCNPTVACQTFSFVGCGFSSTLDLFQTSVNAGWIYSYQCSSALLVDYIPVLVFSFLLSAFILPSLTLAYVHMPAWSDETCGGLFSKDVLMKILPVTMLIRLNKSSNSSSNSSSLTPSTSTSTSSSSNSNSSGGGDGGGGTSFSVNTVTSAPFDSSPLISKQFLNLTIVLTFGLASPVLALTVAVDSAVHVWLMRHLLVQYVDLLISAHASSLRAPAGVSSHQGRGWSTDDDIDARTQLTKLMSASSSAVSVSSTFVDVDRVLTLIAFVAGLFWSLFVVDMVGDVHGAFLACLLMLIPIVCCPLLHFLFIRPRLSGVWERCPASCLPLLCCFMRDDTWQQRDTEMTDTGTVPIDGQVRSSSSRITTTSSPDDYHAMNDTF